ncbi:MAG: B12-binding domain-containing radical SAM protein [Elusimicrobia bacterium CG08_land_8_20_14_0_20_59_10]|nr:MAG: B12-binding domain-containing radical SAM protein [Elusimicrobia bacterium CG08_land_8_20_14_0_20_59_10]
MAAIVLAAYNARYAHCSLGLRCLMANLGELAPRAEMLEFGLELRAAEAAEAVLALKPRIAGLGVYVWNARESAMLAAELKRLCPELILVLGGPEVSYETDAQEICRCADFIITGEADFAFAGLCRRLLAGGAPDAKLIQAPPPDLAALELPYGLYTGEDIAGRVIYTEASRGCPFGCEFCLSSLDKAVRCFPLEKLFAAWESLLAKGALRFKFTDRTFNLDAGRAGLVLDFFLKRYRPGLFLHFETVPDRFPEELFGLLRKFPPGSLQLEAGVQTFNEDAARRINRRQDNAAVERSLRRLRGETGAYLHADLIAGLPGEDLQSFAAGFDRLYTLRPHEIQLGMLKRLRGAPISRHDGEWGMVYSPSPPYEIRQNRLLDFFTVQRLRRFARYWDLVVNSGVFAGAAEELCRGGSPFGAFLAFSGWLYARTGQTHAISRARLRGLLAEYLVSELKRDVKTTAVMMERDAVNSLRRRGGLPRRQALRNNSGETSAG